jgi:protein subunit release factor A
MNNVTKLLLDRAKKAEWQLSIMTKAADEIEAICDKEIAKLKSRVEELESELMELSYPQIDECESENEARRLQAYDREQFYRDLDDLNGEVPTL